MIKIYPILFSLISCFEIKTTHLKKHLTCFSWGVWDIVSFCSKKFFVLKTSSRELIWAFYIDTSIKLICLGMSHISCNQGLGVSVGLKGTCLYVWVICDNHFWIYQCFYEKPIETKMFLNITTIKNPICNISSILTWHVGLFTTDPFSFFRDS